MDKEKHIKRGRDQMRIRFKSKVIGDESVHDLLKLPIEVLYTEALREIGEQEAYIDELQNTIKRLEGENKCLRGNVNSLSLQSQKDGKTVKREELYKQQNARNLALSRRNKELMISNSELIAKIVTLQAELKSLREKFKAEI
jgi:hypothetical protein